MLKTYRVSWLPNDLAAGLVLTTMLVPVGIAYAEASGVPGVYGLYATIVPLLAYAVFGPSRILVLGPDSALAAPILAVVIATAGSDPSRGSDNVQDDDVRRPCLRNLEGGHSAFDEVCAAAIGI
jgi:MFS superfamily sulfate permease-like transporter